MIPIYSLLGLPGIGMIAALYGRYYYNDEKIVVQNCEITIDEIDAVAMVTNDFGRKLMFTVKDKKKSVDFVNKEHQIRVFQWISSRLVEKENKNGNLGITS